MKYFTRVLEDSIEVRFRVRTKDVIGDGVEIIRPGGRFHTVSYEELLKAGSGAFEIDDSQIAYSEPDPA